MADGAPLSHPVQRSTGDSDWQPMLRKHKTDKDREKTIQVRFTMFRC